MNTRPGKIRDYCHSGNAAWRRLKPCLQNEHAASCNGGQLKHDTACHDHHTKTRHGFFQHVAGAKLEFWTWLLDYREVIQGM
ncbi:hypothetical protein PISMIDRAFT_599137 [Pisolithus microcarpus 441]|uniref:Uncharacterized protein n=1 Tax=Pisolithus microcarpus 441 TaxID=765257 RepID=A0A0C9Z1H6_9AGAM|nr:hypothetical protein PISMIDRAFT_599137 [Pisolithus microcarpus 441]